MITSSLAAAISLVDLSQQLGEHPARSVRRHQSPAHLVGHREREAATGLPRLDQVIQLIMEIALPARAAALPRCRAGRSRQ